MSDPYLGYIVGAYCVATTVVAAMVAAIFWDRRSLLKRLADLSNRAAEAEKGAREP